MNPHEGIVVPMMGWESLMLGACDDPAHFQQAYCAHRSLVMGKHVDHGIRIVASGSNHNWATVIADLLNNSGDARRDPRGKF